MNRFFRLQASGITFEEMKSYNSIRAGADGDERPGGLAACDSIEIHPNFGGAWGAYDDGEVVIYEGYITERIYDGVLTEPVKEIARFSMAQWSAMIADETVWEWE